MKYRMAWILMFTMISLAGWCADSYGSRGFKRPAERPDAPVVGEEELYGNSYVLVIGIDAYRPPWPRLSNAVKDAEVVAEALRAQGFEVTLKKNLASEDLERNCRTSS